MLQFPLQYDLKLLPVRIRLYFPTHWGFLCGSAGKKSACNAGDLDLIPGWGKFPWRRGWLPTPVFWPGVFHGLYSPWGLKSRTQLSDFHFLSPLIETELILWLAVGFLGSLVGKEFACNAGDPGSIPGSGRFLGLPAGEGIGYPFQYSRASLVTQLLVKNPPAMWETWIQSLSWEDPLEKGKVTHSSILAWRIPWTG